MSAIDAMAQGSVLDPRASQGGAAPTAEPQRWQNLAPEVSDDRQAAQRAPSKGAPHSAQNRPPEDVAPQLPHVRSAGGAGAGVVIRVK